MYKQIIIKKYLGKEWCVVCKVTIVLWGTALASAANL